MSIMLAALNPNINGEQLAELIKRDGEDKARMIEVFGECVKTLKTPEERTQFVNYALPVLIQFLCF